MYPFFEQLSWLSDQAGCSKVPSRDRSGCDCEDNKRNNCVTMRWAWFSIPRRHASAVSLTIPAFAVYHGCSSSALRPLKICWLLRYVTRAVLFVPHLEPHGWRCVCGLSGGVDAEMSTISEFVCSTPPGGRTPLTRVTAVWYMQLIAPILLECMKAKLHRWSDV